MKIARDQIPNLLSGFRLVAAPFLLWVAWMKYPNLFLILLSVSLLSDAIDGFVASRLNLASDVGTRFDQRRIVDDQSVHIHLQHALDVFERIDVPRKNQNTRLVHLSHVFFF